MRWIVFVCLFVYVQDVSAQVPSTRELSERLKPVRHTSQDEQILNVMRTFKEEIGETVREYALPSRIQYQTFYESWKARDGSDKHTWILSLSFPNGFDIEDAKFLGNWASMEAGNILDNKPKWLTPHTYEIALHWYHPDFKNKIEKSVNGLKRPNDFKVTWYEKELPALRIADGGEWPREYYYEFVPKPSNTIERDRVLIMKVRGVTTHLSSLNKRDRELAIEIYTNALIPCQRVLANETMRRANLYSVMTEDELMIESLEQVSPMNRAIVTNMISEVRGLIRYDSRMELYEFGKSKCIEAGMAELPSKADWDEVRSNP